MEELSQQGWWAPETSYSGKRRALEAEERKQRYTP